MTTPGRQAAIEAAAALAWEQWIIGAELGDPAKMEPEDVFGEGFEHGWLAYERALAEQPRGEEEP